MKYLIYILLLFSVKLSSINVIPETKDVLTVSEINFWSIAEVICSFGQSNAVSHQGLNPETIPSITTNLPVWIFSVNNNSQPTWHGRNVVMDYEVNTGGAYSIMDIYSNYWAANTTRQVIHFKHAKGSTSLQSTGARIDWNVNTTGELYDDFLDEWDLFIADCLNKKIIPIVVLCSWHQGENEIFDGGISSYATWWRELRAAIDDKIGYRCKWLVFTLSSDQFDYDPTDKQIKVGVLRDTIINHIGIEPSVRIFDTDGYTLHTDRLHFAESAVQSIALDAFTDVINNTTIEIE